MMISNGFEVKLTWEKTVIMPRCYYDEVLRRDKENVKKGNIVMIGKKKL